MTRPLSSSGVIPVPQHRWPAAASLALLAALTAGAASASATPPSSAPRGTLAARSQFLFERDARLLADMTAGRLDAVLDPLFADYHARVGEFASWAFQWRTSYTLLRHGALTLATLPLAEPPRAQRLGTAWNDLITAKFDELVLRPAGGLAALRSARDRWLDQLHPALDAVTTDTLLTAALLRGQEPPRETWRRPSLPTPQAEDIPLLTAVGAAAGPLKIRMARPLITRLTIRPPIAAAVTSVGEGLGTLGGLGDIPLIGSAAGLAVTVTAFLSIDYLLSRIDAAVYQDDLEADLHAILEAEHTALRQAWLSAAQEEINQRLATVRRLLEADSLTAPPPPAPKPAAPETPPSALRP